MKELDSCECGGIIRPVFFYNDNTGMEEIDYMVCSDCLREFPVPSVTRAEYERSKYYGIKRT